MLSRNCKAKSEVSPVIACTLFRNPERGDAERGSWKSLSQDQARSSQRLLLYSATEHLSKTNVRAGAVREQQPSIATSLKPSCSLSACPEQRFNPNSFPLVFPVSMEIAAALAGEVRAAPCWGLQQPQRCCVQEGSHPRYKGAELNCQQGSVVRAVFNSLSIL